MKRRNLPLNALRAFEAAARCGRMTVAASELSVTHGAVSRQVQHLEQTLGVALFTGPRSRPVLTPTGQALAQGLMTVFDQLDRAVATALRTEDMIVDVSCLSTLLMRWLIPRLHRFRDLYPTVDVRLQATEQPSDGPRDRMDVLIRVGPQNQPAAQGESVRRLFDEWLGVVAAPALMGRITDARALPPDLMLTTKTRMNAWPMWTQASGFQVAQPVGPIFEHYFFTLEAVSAGLGVCVAPWHLVVDDVMSGRLVAPFGFSRSVFAYSVVSGADSKAPTQQFCDWLVATAAEMPEPAAFPPPMSGRHAHA